MMQLRTYVTIAVVLTTVAVLASDVVNGSPGPGAAHLEVRDWNAAPTAGWIFSDRRDGTHDGNITASGRVLRIGDGEDGAGGGLAELSWPHAIATGERFAVVFRARFLELGLSDESTGHLCLARLHLGLRVAGEDFGVGFSFTGDRYNVEQLTKVYRTDDAWHVWRLEVDTRGKTVALLRDGEYVSLHRVGSDRPPGLRFQVQGTETQPAVVELGRLGVYPLPPARTPATRAAVSRPRDDLAPGDWPMWRRDVHNSGRSPLPGRLTRPRVAWSYPVGGKAVLPFFLDLDGDGRVEALHAHGGTLTAHRLDVSGSVFWKQRLESARVHGVFDLDGDGTRELVVTAGSPGRVLVLRAIDGVTRYSCEKFPMAGVAGVRVTKLDPAKEGLQAVVWSPRHEVGFSLSFSKGIENASIDWTFDWKQRFFTPLVALADMDCDGTLDVVVATYNRTFVFDGRDGSKKIDLEWNSGRNYGTLVVQDVNGDGYPDVVVLADQLREHVAVLQNEGGTSLRKVWDRFHEQNYPDDHVSLRVLTESVGDFDGDDETEVVYAVFDDRTDSRWHTLVVDALTGKVEHDMAGVWLLGAGTFFPRQPPVLLLTTPSGRKDLNENRVALWTFEKDRFVQRLKLPPGEVVGHLSVVDSLPKVWSQGTPTPVLRRLRGDGGSSRWVLPFLRHDAKGATSSVDLLATTAGGRLESVRHGELPANLPPGSVEEVLDATGTGEFLALHAGEDGQLRAIAADATVAVRLETRVGAVAMPLVARLRSGDPPSVCFFDARGILECIRPRVDGKTPDRLWSVQASGCRSHYVPGSRPHGVSVIADIDGDGDGEILVAREPNLLVALGAEGDIERSWEFPSMPILWTRGSFDGDEVPDLLVTYPLGANVDVETVALSGKSGATLWRIHCGNGPSALHDINGDGIDDVILRDLFERRTLDGRTGRDIQPIDMQAGYHTPVVAIGAAKGVYDGVLWVGGAYSLLADDAGGERRWLNWISPTGTAGVADVDGDGRLEIGGITAGQLYDLAAGFVPIDGPHGDFLCHDALTGELEWSVHLGTKSRGVVAADLDHDGRPEFLLGTDDGRLIALRGTGDAGKRTLWELALPAALGAPVVCDADGDGNVDILVGCADGKLYCVNQLDGGER